MWHYINKEEGIDIKGSRQYLKEKLNIFTVYFEDRDEEELVDIWNERHWGIICEEFGITGDDKDE